MLLTPSTSDQNVSAFQSIPLDILLSCTLYIIQSVHVKFRNSPSVFLRLNPFVYISGWNSGKGIGQLDKTSIVPVSQGLS